MSNLCAAAFTGQLTTLQKLLNAPQPPDINGTDATGMTALTRAAIAGKDKAVALLLERKADVMQRDQVRACPGPAPRAWPPAATALPPPPLASSPPAPRFLPSTLSPLCRAAPPP